ncbi:winged helix-turn-helix transcriptional regulator [Nocardia cyriacigeorgica]|uniref:winged helix-turn-helix transcriptional regulator n=1 Tax=Nocardia cyriacigeorgica TaxID=135487 RepID=UPI0024586554|nr:helix-turn-helix domain-containing protein [Nocardia cyriacigeorgica]
MLRQAPDAPRMVTGYQVACDVRDVLSGIGDKWTVLVIAELTVDTRRFLQLHRRVPGISQRMLTVTLRKLERDGLIARCSPRAAAGMRRSSMQRVRWRDAQQAGTLRSVPASRSMRRLGDLNP